MDNLNVLTNENNQVNIAKPPPRLCPRCNSDKTKFCYCNNYTTSQPRYSCKNCRRYWTHGGTLRNVPIGGSCRKVKRARVDQSVSRMVSTGIQQVNHQPFSYVQKNIEFVESRGDSSSAASVGNHLGSLSEIHGGMVTNVSPIQSFRSNYRLDFHDGTFEQDYYNVGSDSPLINQSFGGYVDNHNGYCINQVNQDKWNQSFNNTTNMNHNASTSGSKGFDMNMDNDNNNKYKNSVIRHPCHLEKHDD